MVNYICGYLFVACSGSPPDDAASSISKHHVHVRLKLCSEIKQELQYILGKSLHVSSDSLHLSANFHRTCSTYYCRNMINGSFQDMYK